MDDKIGKIIVYNCKTEDHSSEPNNYFIGKTKKGNPLANPFGIGGKRPSLKKMTFPTREEALNAYKIYFESLYGVDKDLTLKFDEMYSHFKNGETVYLQCFCKPLPCHGDILAEEMRKKLVLETIKDLKDKNKK